MTDLYPQLCRVPNADWAAFFPGYPLVSRLVALPLEGVLPPERAVVIAMCVTVQAASLGAAYTLAQLARPLGRTRVIVALFATFLGPYALYFAASYSEALFLLFSTSAWLCASRGRWVLSGVVAAGATFTRVNGLFLIAGLVTMYLLRPRPAGERRIGWMAAGPVFAISGAFVYWLYLLILTGSPVAWAAAEEHGWKRTTVSPLQAFNQTVHEMLTLSTWDQRVQRGLDIVFAVLLIALIVWLLWRRRWPEMVYSVLTAAAIMTSFDYVSLARNTAVVFPAPLAVAETAGRRTRVLYAVAAILALALLIFNTHAFTLGYWAD